jgi:type II secretory pathway pseudopilin PulG
MKPPQDRPVKAPAEQGYILVAVMFMLALLTISLTVVEPRIARVIQRDREVETMYRGKQYTRAIRLYYRKFGAYPPNVDALVKTNEIRFLRQRYLDPMTGQDDWKPIYLGQNKTPLAMGFFGEPLSVVGSMLPGAPPVGGSGFAGTPPAGSGIGSAQGAGSAFGPNSNSPFGSNDSGQASDSDSGSGDSPTGQTFGGGPIIGFAPGSPRESILSYKKMNHFNQWEFLYTPLSDQMTLTNNPITQPPLQWGSPGAPPQTSPQPAPIPSPPQ